MKKFVQMLLNVITALRIKLAYANCTAYNLKKELNEKNLAIDSLKKELAEKNLELQKLDDEEWFQAELTGYKLWQLEKEQKKYEDKNTYINNDEKYMDWNPTNSYEIDHWWWDYHTFEDSDEFMGLDFSDIYETQIRIYQDEEDMACWDEEVQRLNELAYLQDFYAEHIEKIKAQKTICDKLAYYITQPIDQPKTDKKPVSTSCFLEFLQTKAMNRMEKQLKEQKDEIDILYAYIEEQHTKAKRRALLNWCKEVSEYYMYEDDWCYDEDSDSYYYEYGYITEEDYEDNKYTTWDYFEMRHPKKIFASSDEQDRFEELAEKQKDYAPWAAFMDDPAFYTYDYDINKYFQITNKQFYEVDESMLPF